MRRYEQYKPSGLDWLADVPSHWQVVANRALFSERQEAGEDGLPVLSVSLHTGVSDDEQNEEENARTRTRMADRTSYKRVRPGDVAYNMMRAWQGAIGAVRTDGLVSPAYVVAAPTDALNPAYFEYLYRTDWLIGEMNRASKGITDFRKRLYWQEFKQISTLVPPLDEQDRIVAFLDQKTTEVDAAIAKKERLIELLAEQRGIQINQAVTRGLQPNVALRDSGVEWLGIIPQHWESVPLKHVSAVQSGLTLGKNYAQLRGAKRYPYLRVANVQDGYIDLSEVTEITMPVREAKNYLLRTGDILVTEGGDIDKLGRGNCWYGEIEECLHQNHVFAVRVLCKVRPEFVSLITGVPYARRYFTTTANKTTNLASTNKTKLGNLPLLVPPLQEQDAILAHCHDVKVGFAELVAGVNKEIAALKEMKNVLIAETISGKIKI